MNWLIKISQQPDNRRKMTSGSYINCPQCSSMIWNGQKYNNCPHCGRSTEDLNPRYLARCPDCGTSVMTGKVGDCEHCGFDWKAIQIFIDDPIKKLYAPGRPDYFSSIIQPAWNLGAENLNDLTRLSYDKLKQSTMIMSRKSLENLPAYKRMKANKEEALKHYGIATWKNIMFVLSHKLQYTGIVLPEQVRRWIKYMEDEFNYDIDIVDYENRRKREEENYRKAKEEESIKLNRQIEDLAKLISYHSQEDNWPGWEDATYEDSYKTAEDFFTADPYDRGMFRESIKNLARKVIDRKKTPIRYYLMTQDEAEEYINKIKNINLKENSEVSDDALADIISKTVAITGNKIDGDPTWDDKQSIPGLSAAVLGQSGFIKVDAMKEYRRRLKESEFLGDKRRFSKLYYSLDVDLRNQFFKEKE